MFKDHIVSSMQLNFIQVIKCFVLVVVLVVGEGLYFSRGENIAYVNCKLIMENSYSGLNTIHL